VRAANGAPSETAWHCPRCRAALAVESETLMCAACSHVYPTFGGIPDLRIDMPNWLDVDADRQNASCLAELAPSLSSEDLVYAVFRRRAGWTDREIRRRTRGLLDSVERCGRDLEGWLRAPTEGARPFLDLGCGGGPLLAAAAARGRAGIGIDVSLEWLVVAERLIRERGGTPRLAAAMAEALPLDDCSVGGVVSLDVIEHVGNQRKYLREMERVVASGGLCALATPNRYSLAAEPHVSVWGVGWVPRPWQKSYVRWRSGKSYDYCRLLGVRELRAEIRNVTTLDPRVLLGPVPSEDLQRFRPAKAVLAHIYNWAIRFSTARAAVILVSPFFRVLARKPV
jgi:SAM-dependent methyltransferase